MLTRLQKIEQLKKRIKQKLDKKLEEHKNFIKTEIRYDEIYFKGVEWLDKLASPPEINKNDPLIVLNEEFYEFSLEEITTVTRATRYKE